MKRWLAVFALGALFAVTGADALLVEQTAEKLLSTVVGSSTLAGAIVLAVYFGGLALGGFLSARMRAFFKDGLAMYAALEIAVGVFALLLGLTFPAAQDALARMVSLAGDAFLATLALRVLAAVLWLLAPTVAMGATYPAVVDALSLLGVQRVPLAMARLYALNLLGAVASAFIGAYLILPALGMTGTLLAVSGAQLVVAACAFALSRVLRAGRPVLAPASFPTTTAASSEGIVAALLRSSDGRVLLTAAFFSGAAVFVFEVLWVQLIGAVVGMSVYAFAQMLGVVLVGLWIGGGVVSFATAKRPALPAGAIPIVFILAGGATALAGRSWDTAPLWLLDQQSDITSFFDGERVRLFAVLRLLLPATVALGLIYPSLFRSGLFPAQRASATAGALGGVNAIGGIAGALLAGFVLIPLLGTEVAYRAACCVLVVIGVVFALARRVRGAMALVTGLAGALVVVWVTSLPRWDPLLLTSGINLSFHIGDVHPRDQLLFWEEDTAAGFTTVIEHGEDAHVHTLLSNGKLVGDDSALDVQRELARLPCALTSQRDRALVVGLGTGVSADVMRSAGFASVEVAELSRSVVDAAREQFSAANHRVLDDKRVSLTIDDARNHLLRSSRAYDVISMEVTSIWFAGAASLYTRELYELARQHLAEHGVLYQWMDLAHVAPDDVLSALATMKSELPHVQLWRVRGQGMLIGSNESVRPPAHVDVDVDVDVDVEVLLDEDAVARAVADVLARGVPINTDANRWLEMQTPRHNRAPGDDVERALAALRTGL